MTIRTNAVDAKKYDDVLVKPFKYTSMSNWNDKKTYGKGVVILNPVKRSIEVNLYDLGINGKPYFDDMVSFLMSDKDIRYMIREYYQKGRKYGFRAVEAVDYKERRVFIIDIIDPRFYIKKDSKVLTRISSRGKTNGLKPMYIGDFAELVACAVKGNWSIDLSKSARKKSGFRYIPPKFYYYDEINHSPNKLI